MSLRNFINKNGHFLALAFLLAAGLLVYFNMSGSSGNSGGKYDHYTADDGQSYFRATLADHLPPFDYGGKQAVKAYVYTCGAKPFVAYLERYTPEARDFVLRASKKSDQPPADIGRAAQIMMNGTEVKRPGDAAWVKSNSPAGSKLMSIKCDNGADIQAVVP